MRELILLTIAAGMVWAQAPSCQARAGCGSCCKRSSRRAPCLSRTYRRQEWRSRCAASSSSSRRKCSASGKSIWSPRAFHLSRGRLPKIALPDRWWRKPVTSQYLGLTADQQRKMDDVLQQFRSRLIRLTTGTPTTGGGMEPLVSAEPLDEAKITCRSTAWRRLARSWKKPMAGCCWGFAGCSLRISGSN